MRTSPKQADMKIPPKPVDMRTPPKQADMIPPKQTKPKQANNFMNIAPKQEDITKTTRYEDTTNTNRQNQHNQADKTKTSKHEDSTKTSRQNKNK